jgi:hypothetical protein
VKIKIMAALELLCNFVGVNLKKLSREETFILEAELYNQVAYEIWKTHKTQYKDYFNLLKTQVDNIMELEIIRCLINDILKSEAYTLSGIAYYTQTPEEVIQDLFCGYRIGPVIMFIRRLIELHKLVRPDVYRNIIKKITPDESDEE